MYINQIVAYYFIVRNPPLLIRPYERNCIQFFSFVCKSAPPLPTTRSIAPPPTTRSVENPHPLSVNDFTINAYVAKVHPPPTPHNKEKPYPFIILLSMI